MSSFRFTAPLLLTLFTTVSCGGSGSSDFEGVGATTGAKEIVISQSGQDITTSPGTDDIVTISGSNNIIWLKTKPKSISISGNDNLITTPTGSTVHNKGLGNDITYSNSVDNGASTPVIKE